MTSKAIQRQRRETPLADRIPYTAHVAPHVVRTVAGDYVQVFRLNGASFETADDADVNTRHARLNTLLRNIASPNLAVWTHLVRRRESTYPAGQFTVPFAASLNEKYRARVTGERLMANELYLSLVYRSMPGRATGLTARLLTRSDRHGAALELADALEQCDHLRRMVLAQLDLYEPEGLGVVKRGGSYYSQLLEFFGLLINTDVQPVPLPIGPIGHALGTTRPIIGLETIEYRLPTLTRVGAVWGIKEYASPTVPGMLDPLLSAPFPFVLTQSFAFLSKPTAQSLLVRQKNRLANAGDFAVSQAAELDTALDELSGGDWVMGDHHWTLQVLSEALDGVAERDGAPRLKPLNDRLAAAAGLLVDTRFTLAREDLGLESAFWAQLPGVFALRPRKAPISSRNFAALSPFHTYPAGRPTGNHWGEATTLLITTARSPYYFSLHASDPREPGGGSRKDIGHTLILGPTGSGKTVWVGFMIAMLTRFGTTQIVIDKDRGLEILTRALGGEYFPLKNGVPTGLNPLQLPNTPLNVDFLRRWVRTLVRPSDRALSVREEADLDQALRGTLALEPSRRRLSRLLEFLDATDSEGVHARLTRWCEVAGGEYAWAFDHSSDGVTTHLAECTLIGFDVTDFLEHDAIRAPLTLYLFHLVRSLLDGRRLVCWADEFSKLLDDPAFESFAKDGLKTWRKLNGVLVAATQSPSDALASPIARTILEQTSTKICMPNADAIREDYIEGCGLTEREFLLVKDELTPGSRTCLIKQGAHSVVCQLDLQGMDAELAVISGRASTVALMHQLITRYGAAPSAWLSEFCAYFASEARGARS
jgi:type IV secretion system protein VirB4